MLLGGRVWLWSGTWDQQSRVRIPAAALTSTTLGKLFTHVPLSPSSIIWYRPNWAVMLGGWEVTAGLAESNGSLSPGSWLRSRARWLPRTGISSGTLRSFRVWEKLHRWMSLRWGGGDLFVSLHGRRSDFPHTAGSYRATTTHDRRVLDKSNFFPLLISNFQWC